MADAHDKQRELDAVLGALGHEARRQILVTVWFHAGAMSAGEIAARFAHSWPTTSRHLRVLEQAGLLEFEKDGRTRRYRLNHDRLQIVRDWLRWFQDAPPMPEGQPAAPPQVVLRNIALAYPEAREQASAGEIVIAVRKRPFLVLREGDGDWALRLKLPHSRGAALRLPFAEPVVYRLGTSDWVAASFGPGQEVPLELLWEWVDESYRAVAPKRLLTDVPGPPAVPRTPRGS